VTLLAWITGPGALRRGLQIAGGVVAIALVVIGAWAWYRAQESRAEAALAEATTLVRQASEPQAPTEAQGKAIKALEGFVSDHPRFSGLSRVAAYELALAKGASGTLKGLIALGIGYTWEGEKNYAAAATAHEAALTAMGPKGFLYEDTLMALARAQELGGKPAAAVETYQRLLKDVPDTPRADDLRTRLAHLKSRPATR